MIFREKRILLLDQLKTLATQKGVVFDDELTALWVAAKRKPSYLEQFCDSLAIALDELEKEKKESDNLLFGERHDGELEDNKADRDNSVIEQPRIQSDGSLRDGNTASRGTVEEPKIASKAYIPAITPYHWSKKKEWFKQKETIRECSPTVQKAFCLKRRVGSATWYYLDEQPQEGEWEEFDLKLNTEPGIPEFEGMDYIDVVSKHEEEIEDAFERKGRISLPIDLSKYPELALDDELMGIGVDIARYGSDSSVILVRHGIHVIDVQKFSMQDTMTTTGYIVQAINDFRPSFVNLESVGLGAGVVDRLFELGLDEITNICGIETQGQKVRFEHLKAFNIRTEMFLLLRERFAEGRISLPPNNSQICEELAHIKFRILSDGRIAILENREIRKSLGFSPDHAIALALAFYPQTEINIY